MMKAVLLVPLIYLAAPLIIVILSRTRISAANITSAIFLVAFLACLAAFFSGITGPLGIQIRWFDIGGIPLHIRLEISDLTLSLLTFTTLVGWLVATWSGYYFKDNGPHTRFYLTLSVFMFAMTGLLEAAHLLLIFFLWELVGLCSYLLIGHYRGEREAGRASMLAMLINKAGDIGLLMSIAVLWSYGSGLSGDIDILDLATLAQHAGRIPTGVLTAVSAGVLMAICSKSALFPFHIWLPRAMAGPTPASALIHSATMVATGIILYARLEFMFPETVRMVAGGIGLITALLGGWNALSQQKIKSLLAYTTMSQLGLMMLAAGWGDGESVLLHLKVHGILKAGLFMLTGTWLLKLHQESKSREAPDQQHELMNLRRLAASDRWLTGLLLAISLGLCGVPLSSGFVSKELMLEGLRFPWAQAAFFAVNTLTVLYLTRMLWFIVGPVIEEKTIVRHNWQVIAALVPVALATLWIAAATLPFKFPPDHLTIISGSWVLLLLLGAWMLRKSDFFLKTEKYFPELNLNDIYVRMMWRAATRLSVTLGKADRGIIDRLVNSSAIGVVVLSRITAFFERWVIDGFYTITARTGTLAGRALTGISGIAVQGYLWWAIGGLLILLIWQT